MACCRPTRASSSSSTPSITRPDELYVQAAKPGAEARAGHPDAHAALPRPGLDGARRSCRSPRPTARGAIYTRVYTPKDFDPARKYPAVVFVHGAGYLQEVTYGWSSYFHEFMFTPS